MQESATHLRPAGLSCCLCMGDGADGGSNEAEKAFELTPNADAIMEHLIALSSPKTQRLLAARGTVPIH